MQTTPSTLSEKKDTLRACRYFSTLPEDLLVDLAQGMTLVRYKAGEDVFWQGDACRGLHILKRGSVKLYRISPQGREFIVKVVEEEETFNEVPVFDGRENPVNAAVLEESDIWEISAHTIRRMMNNHPDMCHGVVLNLSQNLRNLMDMVEQLLFYQVTHRLARLLCQLSVEQQQASLTQQQLAARLGTVREVVARSLRQLQRSGAIQTRRGRVEVINPDILRDWSQGPM